MSQHCCVTVPGNHISPKDVYFCNFGEGEAQFSYRYYNDRCSTESLSLKTHCYIYCHSIEGLIELPLLKIVEIHILLSRKGVITCMLVMPYLLSQLCSFPRKLLAMA